MRLFWSTSICAWRSFLTVVIMNRIFSFFRRLTDSWGYYFGPGTTSMSNMITGKHWDWELSLETWENMDVCWDGIGARSEYKTNTRDSGFAFRDTPDGKKNCHVTLPGGPWQAQKFVCFSSQYCISSEISGGDEPPGRKFDIYINIIWDNSKEIPYSQISARVSSVTRDWRIDRLKPYSTLASSYCTCVPNTTEEDPLPSLASEWVSFMSA
jgi:hypothetical protein